MRSIVCLSLLIVLAPCVARAEDASQTPLEAEASALEKTVAAHVKAKDADALVADMDALLLLYRRAGEEDDVQARLVAAIGSITKFSKKGKGEDVLDLALTVLGETTDLRAAPYVKPFLKQRDVKKAGRLLLTAIFAAGRLPDEGLVEPLLKLVEKSKDYEVAADAIRALGNYKSCKKKRELILVRLVKSVQKGKPSGNAGLDPLRAKPKVLKKGSPVERWAVLSEVLPDALNKLTGQNLARATTWFEIVQESQRTIGKLFKDEEGEQETSR